MPGLFYVFTSAKTEPKNKKGVPCTPRARKQIFISRKQLYLVHENIFLDHENKQK